MLFPTIVTRGLAFRTVWIAELNVGHKGLCRQGNSCEGGETAEDGGTRFEIAGRMVIWVSA